MVTNYNSFEYSEINCNADKVQKSEVRFFVSKAISERDTKFPEKYRWSSI